MGARANAFFSHVSAHGGGQKPGEQPAQIRGSPALPLRGHWTLPRSSLADPLPGRTLKASSTEMPGMQSLNWILGRE